MWPCELVCDASEAERYRRQLPQRNRIRPSEHVHGIHPFPISQSEAQLRYLHQFHPVEENIRYISESKILENSLPNKRVILKVRAKF